MGKRKKDDETNRWEDDGGRINDPNPVVAICPKCNLAWRLNMMYSCSSYECPMQLRIKI